MAQPGRCVSPSSASKYLIFGEKQKKNNRKKQEEQQQRLQILRSLTSNPWGGRCADVSRYLSSVGTLRFFRSLFKHVTCFTRKDQQRCCLSISTGGRFGHGFRSIFWIWKTLDADGWRVTPIDGAGGRAIPRTRDVRPRRASSKGRWSGPNRNCFPCKFRRFRGLRWRKTTGDSFSHRRR